MFSVTVDWFSVRIKPWKLAGVLMGILFSAPNTITFWAMCTYEAKIYASFLGQPQRTVLIENLQSIKLP